ncbi:OmpA family protein [Pedobacter sp.]|uniref:OmpA family protein n=1 Tax=Pedobacter sp. TaxID=1411316 RepID=UPI003D7FF342
MAEYQNKPHSKNNWLLWLIAIIVVIALVIFFTRNSNDKLEDMAAASDSATIESEINANWSGVDPNIPVSNYEELKDTSVEVRAGNAYTVYSLKEAVLFEPGKYEVGKNGAEKLTQIARSAKKRYADGKITVYGYTDSTGTDANNKQLAFKRADAVKSWLVKYGEFDATQINIQTQGESNPISTNKTAQGRAENRRVDIVVRKNEQ